MEAWGNVLDKSKTAVADDRECGGGIERDVGSFEVN